MNVIIDSLKSLFPFDVSCESMPSPKDRHLIAVLLHRKFYNIHIGSVGFIGIEPRKDESFSAAVYKKQIAEYQQKLESNCAYILKHPSTEQISAFIKNQIPFVSDNQQIYIPFLGVCLSGLYAPSKEICVEKMMPATQEVFLYLFYGDKKYYLKSEIADFLKLSRTSLTRASDELIAMDLINQTKVGKEYRMELKEKGTVLYKKAEKYLISPVHKEFYVDSAELAENALKTEESALAECSMMNPPKIPQVALFKDDERAANLRTVDIRWEDCSNPVKVQLWKYPPEIFAKGGRVDTVSMLCTLKHITDERIEGEIEEILEGEKW